MISDFATSLPRLMDAFAAPTAAPVCCRVRCPVRCPGWLLRVCSLKNGGSYENQL